MSGLRRATAGVATVVLVALLALLSGVPYTAEPAQRAIVRLSWRARGERVQRCRRPSDEELEKLPVHMRPREICERGIVPYRLRVRVDDSLAVDALVRAGGAQGDRPLFVFAEVPLSPGTHRLAIAFEREGSDHKKAGSENEESDNQETGDLRETPPRLTLEQTVTLAPRAIVLVTYDDEQRRLALLAGGDTAR
jgi:hypothetical protein